MKTPELISHFIAVQKW